MNYANDEANNKARLGSYGTVVECVHADTQTIAVLDGYSRFDAIAHKGWSRGESAEDVALRFSAINAEAISKKNPIER